MEQKPTITQTFEAEGIKNLHLETVSSGNIELVGHDENTILVEVFASVRSIDTLFFVREPLAAIDPETNHFKMEVSGNTLHISSKPIFFNIYNWFHFQHISFRVSLPKTVGSYSKTWGGNITLTNVESNHEFVTWGGKLLLQNARGNFQGKTMGGKVEVSNCEGKIKAKTMGGKIVLLDNHGEINADTMGGNVYIRQHSGQVHATTWGGNIEASNTHGNFECSTMGGNIHLSNVNGNIGASTKGGNINVAMASINQYAWFDTAGGNIEAFLPLENPIDLEVVASKIYAPRFPNFDGYFSKRSIRGKLNGGGANVTIKTNAGKVSIGQTYLKPDETKFQPNANLNFAKPSSYQENTPKSEKIKTAPIEKPIANSNHQSFSFTQTNFFYTLAFCLLLGYGLSSIVYFTLEFFNPRSVLSPIYKGVFYSNIAHSFATLCAIYTFIYGLENRLRSTWLKYLVLSAVTFLYVGISQMIVGILYWSQIDSSLFRRDQNNSSGVYYTFLPVIVSCAYYFYWRRTRQITRKISEQEYQLLNLEKLKSKAQLDALEAKINPHFLYNSLNSIAGLIHEQPDKAEEMTIQLSKLFRYTTGRNEDNFHTFADELEIIKAYLAIEQVRFGNRLVYSIDCEETILPHKIPRFLLQPLVENAIKHGISKIANDGEINIEISQSDEFITIKIHDNGPAFDELLGGGFGLRSIKEKLKIVYAEKANFEIENEPEKAVIVTLPK